MESGITVTRPKGIVNNTSPFHKEESKKSLENCRIACKQSKTKGDVIMIFMITILSTRSVKKRAVIA